MNKNLIVFIIIGVVIFVLGIGLGIFYQIKRDTPRSEALAAIIAGFKNITSRAIPSIVAYGQVTNISGRNLTLSYNGDNVTVAINNNASIISFVKNGNSLPTQQKIDFSQIKKGDTLNISVKLLQSGQLEGESVIVLSSE